MNEFKLTEKMVLALLGKAMVYEIGEMDMEYDIKIPLDVFGLEDDVEPKEIDVKIKMSMSNFKFEIQKG
jgi:hypothetical protein